MAPKMPVPKKQKLEIAREISTVEKIMIAFMVPVLARHCEYHIPDVDDPQPAYPLNTTSKYQPVFPQIVSNYPTGHPLAGLPVSDVSGNFLQLSIVGGDEITQCLYLEDKNPSGLWCPYRAIHPSGSTDFPMPVGSAVVQASGFSSAPETVFLDAGSAVYDATLFTASSSAATSPVAGLPLTLGTLYPNCGTKPFHGTLLAVGKSKKYGRTYIHQSGCAQATIGAACFPISAADPFVSAAFSANVLSSCAIIQCGTGGAAIGDVFHFSLYGFNEGNDYPICNINFRLTATVAAGAFLCALPCALRDEVRLVGNVSIVSTVTSVPTNIDIVRNISWGVMSCGGQLTSQMMNGVNSPFVIGQYTATRLIANSTDADNWTSEFSLGARAGSVQFPVNQYYGNQGFDQGGSPSQNGTGVYNTVANQPDEETDILKFGNYRYLCPAGTGRFAWRDNVDTVSTLYAPVSGPFTGTTVMVSYDLEMRNQYIQVFVSPGVGGNQAAQMLEITHTVMAEALTQSVTLQTHMATATPDQWAEAARRLGSCKHSGRKPDPEYFFSTEGYKQIERARYGTQECI